MLGGLVPTQAIRITLIIFDSFPLICLELNSNPSE